MSDIRPEFTVHMLSESGVTEARTHAEGFSALLDGVEALGVTGRRLALVRTHLEDACFQAKKGIAELPENQKDLKA